MPLEAVHLLITLKCTYECDHCFLHCGPHQPGAMTFPEVEGLLEQAAVIEGVNQIYFEGGEPMLYYPMVHSGVGKATELGMRTAVVTCGYFATTVPDGETWLRPLRDLGLGAVEVSLDPLHGNGEASANGRNLAEAARRLGLDVTLLSICDPREEECGEAPTTRSDEEPTPAMLKGRAAHQLVEGMPLKHVREFTECPFEELERPRRVHVDPFGNLHICQGILAGNVWESSLSQIVRGYDPVSHPILGPLIEGGPLALAERWGMGADDHFATECHACYEIRRALLRNPDLRRVLGPNQVYGEEPEPPLSSYV